jgi:hypothetical protein
VNRVESPISPGDRGPLIADLHAALRAMIDNGYLTALAFTAETQDVIQRGLPVESEAASYGPAAQLFVARLQEFIGAGDSSAIIDARTAGFINRTLTEWGLVDAGRERFVVSGLVIGGSAGQRVVAYDEDMRSPQRLNDGAIDERGRYEITYFSDQFARAGKQSADLRLVVVDSAEKELARTPVLFNAAPVQVAPDLVVPAPEVSESEQLTAELRPVMGEVTFEDLTDSDIGYLSGATGIAAERIGWMAEAFRGSQASPARGKGLGRVPAEAFYGLFREGIPAGYLKALGAPLKTLKQALAKAVTDNVIPPQFGRQLKTVLAALQAWQADLALTPAGEGTPASLGDLLAAVPERLDPDQATALATNVGPGGIGALHQEDLDTLVSAGTLGQELADRVSAAAVAFHLGDKNVAIAKAVLGLSAEDGTPRVPGPAGLAALEAGDWQSLLTSSGIAAPDGMTDQAYAEQLTTRVAAVLPSQFLGHRVTALPPDLAGLIEDGHDQQLTGPLAWLTGRNPGLALADVLARPQAASAKAGEIERRVGLFADTLRRNPGRNLLELDHSPDSTDLDGLSLPETDDADRERILANLRAHQRAFLAAGDARTAVTLLDQGFDASRKIVALSPERFQQESGLSAEQALAVHQAATRATTWASVKTIALHQLARAHQPLPTRDDPRDFLARIPGYRTLFPDDAGLCDCTECASVLGLPAYFADLMLFVDQHILDHLPSPGTLAIHLRRRRDDLWKLELTCENANRVVAYLDIVNAILDGYLRRTSGLAENEDVWAKIAEKNPSFALPFELPLLRIQAYLSHFRQRRVDVAIACGADEAARARAYLGLTEAETGLVNTPAAQNLAALTLAEIGFMDKLYGGVLTVYPNGQVESTGVGVVFVPALLDATGASRTLLGELLATGYVAAGAPTSFRSGRQSQQSLQNDVEVVEGLTAAHLDRLHRFYRLSRRVPWTIPELDRTLRRLKDSGLAASLDEPRVLAWISGLSLLQERLGLDVEQLCGLWTRMPNDAHDDQPGLFDALFNPPQLAALGTPIAYTDDPSRLFLHPSFRPRWIPVPADDGTLLARLLAGLRVSDDDLVYLLETLAAPLNLGSRIRWLALTAGNLTLLYRHATLARVLNVPVPQLFQLIRLAGTQASYLRDWSLAGSNLQDDLTAVLTAREWIDRSGFAVDEIAFITGQDVLDRARLTIGEPRSDIDALVDAMLRGLQADHGYEFADTVLSGLPNPSAADQQRTLTEEQSRQIIQANLALFDQSGQNRFRLNGMLTAASITIPATPPGLTVTPADVAAELTRHSVPALMRPALAKAFGISAEKLDVLLRLSGEDVTVGSTAFQHAITSVVYGSSADPGLVLALAQALAPFVVLYRDARYDETTLAVIEQHRDPFVVPVGPLQPEAVRLATQFRSLLTGPDPGYVSSGPPADIAAVLQVVREGVPANPAVTSDALARALRTDPARIGSLHSRLAAILPANPLDAMTVLAAALGLAGLLGVTGETLGDLVLGSSNGTEHERLARAADALLAGFRTKYASDAEFAQKVEPYEERLRSCRRDGLVAYIRFTEPGKFRTEDDLYAYFLVDVAVEGCARTTRLAAAVFSLQLYVHRVMMRLEKDARGFDVAQHALIPPEEWEWRRHFRMWQANRQVFLYPENYLEPGIRDDKTPLFRDLENTLMQQQVTEQNVRDAYAQYLVGFDEIAGLRMAAACWQPGNPDVLHLFATSSSEPPLYHYRTITGLGQASFTKNVGFTPWRRIDLQISSPSCSAVVHRGMLYVFWAEATTLPKTSFKNGSSEFTGYKHKLAVKFTSLRLDGRWNAPQRLRFVVNGAESQTIEIEDPLIPAETSGLVQLRKDLLATISARDKALQDWLQNPADDAKKSHVDDLNKQIGDLLAQLPATGRVAYLDPLKRAQPEPIDDYTLSSLYITAFPYSWNTTLVLSTLQSDQSEWTIDIFRRTATVVPPDERDPQDWSSLSLILDQGHPTGLADASGSDTVGWGWANPYAQSGARLERGIAATPTTAMLAFTPSTGLAAIPVNGDPEAAIVTVGTDVFYARLHSGSYATTRLGSTVADATAETVTSSAGGLEEALSIRYQWALREVDLPFTLSPSAGGGTPAEQIGFTGRKPDGQPYPIDYHGASGGYYRELWCHIPWVIADYLHSQGRFSDAKRWYEVVFNPTAAPEPPVSAENKRVWQFREFREELLQTLRAALDDQAQLNVYRIDPLSPHAIARLRPGAYQKAVVMQYIDNLIDWGDSLFTQFTAESINEATMLYVLALDLLGPRARPAGPCSNGKLDDHGQPIPVDYEHLAPALRAGHEFVIEMENLFVTHRLAREPSAIELARAPDAPHNALVVPRARAIAGPAPADGALAGIPSEPLAWHEPPPAYWAMSSGTPLPDLVPGALLTGPDPTSHPPSFDGRSPFVGGDPLDPPVVGPRGVPGLQPAGYAGPLAGSPGLDGRHQRTRSPAVATQPWQLLDASLAFCIPDNKGLRGYWDLVEGRLANIRNCRDIDGKQRVPDLFGPAIDPHLLLKLKAAGLTLDDVMNVTSGNVPPYRFTFLLEKARQYAGTVQSFGTALLAALEKRDGETLANLRTAHEQRLLKLRAQLQDLEISVAQQTYAGLLLQQQAAEYRRDYYRNLSQTGLNAWERTQQVSRELVSNLHEVEAVSQLVRAVLSLLPDIGAPTAMKYGGVATSGAASGFALASQALAQGAEAVSESAGLEATFQRRDDDWKHQAALAQRDVDQLKNQVAAAEFRIKIAEQSRDVHQATIDQTEEIHQFSLERFTSLGLYTYLSTSLQRLYRQAFNSAQSMALLAEQAYHYERPADEEAVLTRDYWDPAAGGLLAGERLLLDLESLERRYLETNYRQLEVEQSFSLAQFKPEALASLRETGKCTFDVPELFYDLAYPGHYQRRIKAVRITLPCVVGPYTNPSATLRLLNSQLRVKPDGDLKQVPPRHSVSVATSTGQNDSGVFEFTFRDERYLPFEGSGAVSSWELRLPKAFRPFDYDTISDVILRISYTAEEDSKIRDTIDDALGTAENALAHRLQTDGLPLLISLRRDLPDVWRKLVTSPAGTGVEVTIEERRLPVILTGWLRGRALRDAIPAKKPQVSLETTSILLDASEKPDPDDPDPDKHFRLTAHEKTAVPGDPLTFGNRDTDNGLFSAAFSTTKTVTPPWADVTLVLTITSAANFAPPQPPPNAPAPAITIDETKLRDVMILSTLKIAAG